MGSFLGHLIGLAHLFFLLPLCFLVANSLKYGQQPLCHNDERQALLQFNQSILLDESASLRSHAAFPKTTRWKLQGSGDCCSWDGIECDGINGHVIGLDLSGSFLFGCLNSSSSLFHLVHLQKLNLAFNNFNYSQIPSEIGRLSSLTYLNLSGSSFFGEIPLEISTLSKLTILDLSLNIDSSDKNLLAIQKPSLNSLIQNLTRLKVLALSQVSISAPLPDTLSSLTSLTTLYLRDCDLQGKFPAAVFQLPNFQSLSVRYNPYLTGYLPEFNESSPLNFLKVAGTSFSGKLPASISKLKSLTDLDISECGFYGAIPSSIGNLTRLQGLDLSYNMFDMSKVGDLAWLGKKTELTSLGLAGINLNGTLPSFLANLTALASLNLAYTQLTGNIPSWLGNLTQLTEIRFGYNQLQDSIPKSFSRLINLEQIYLEFNHLNGTVELDMFLNFTNLFDLQLSYNTNLSLLPQQTSVNGTSRQKFVTLGLAQCHLGHFPDFLRHQDRLMWLDLENNNIPGKIPKWMLNVGKDSLRFLALSINFLTGFEQQPTVLPWNQLRILELRANMLQGSLPIPPPFTFYYSTAYNQLTGEISPLMCNLKSLDTLDLSHNHFNGSLPQCLHKLSNSLKTLNLQDNMLHGTIPKTCVKGSKLKMIKLSQNQLQGPLLKSFANCSMLEYLDLGNNQINDNFPWRLGTLPELKVLIMRSCQLYGTIGSPETKFQFPKLHIIDLSHNNFTGKLPSEYFKIWNSMTSMNASDSSYMQGDTSYQSPGFSYANNYSYAMILTNKGTQRTYVKIPMYFTVVDLSSNRFEGNVPESIANLKGLQLLNLSNNHLVGRIPSCLGNLTALESLDLSQNKLSGRIPEQLVGLTFLGALDVSYNNLTGPIPGGQLSTFPNISFEGNPGLCGEPLSKKCGNPRSPSPPSTSEEEEETDSKFPSGYDWIFIFAGCVSGLVIGSVAGHTITTWKHRWFVETFGNWSTKRAKWKTRRCRNGTPIWKH